MIANVRCYKLEVGFRAYARKTKPETVPGLGECPEATHISSLVTIQL